MTAPGTYPPPGLQVERTALAWRRTALSLVVVCLLTARLVVGSGPVALVIATLGVVAAGAVAVAASRRDGRRLRNSEPLAAAIGPAVGLVSTSILLAVGVLALVALRTG